METTDTNSAGHVGSDLVERLLEEGWIYVKTIVDVVREPILILNKDLAVMAANESFYRTFQSEPKDTEGKVVYELGNGQWDIPALRKLLEDILPKNTFFKGFEVAHEFPYIGRKVLIMNARQIHFRKGPAKDIFPATILLAMEDVTELMEIAAKFAGHANQLQTTLIEETQKLETKISRLEKEMGSLKKRS